MQTPHLLLHVFYYPTSAAAMYDTDYIIVAVGPAVQWLGVGLGLGLGLVLGLEAN